MKKNSKQTASLKKTIFFGAAETKLGPSYFVRALVYFYTMVEIIKME